MGSVTCRHFPEPVRQQIETKYKRRNGDVWMLVALRDDALPFCFPAGKR
jgi:hypothetical protein